MQEFDNTIFEERRRRSRMHDSQVEEMEELEEELPKMGGGVLGSRNDVHRSGVSGKKKRRGMDHEILNMLGTESERKKAFIGRGVRRKR